MGGDALYDGGGGQEDRKGREEEDGKTLNRRGCGAVSAAVSPGRFGATGLIRYGSSDARQTIQIQAQ